MSLIGHGHRLRREAMPQFFRLAHRSLIGNWRRNYDCPSPALRGKTVTFGCSPADGRFFACKGLAAFALAQQRR
jgi:hypothetical protein